MGESLKDLWGWLASTGMVAVVGTAAVIVIGQAVAERPAGSAQPGFMERHLSGELQDARRALADLQGRLAASEADRLVLRLQLDELRRGAILFPLERPDAYGPERLPAQRLPEK